jgi:hypothetical protein
MKGLVDTGMLSSPFIDPARKHYESRHSGLDPESSRASNGVF